MGLDQYAFAKKEGQTVVKIAYWRKHPNLQGWMECLWRRRYNKGMFFSDTLMAHPKGNFNGEELVLTEEDILQLYDEAEQLPVTTGFFFSQSRVEDVVSTEEFCIEALDYISRGYQIVYDSSW